MTIQLPRIVRRSKRVGRGIGSRGAKSGRGMKGQKSRAGFSRKAGFEGGQTPLYMRLPKGRGQKQRFPSCPEDVYTLTVQQLGKFADGSIVGPGQLRKARLLTYHHKTIKLIGGGPCARKVTVRVHAATQGAKKAVESAGGKVEIISSE